MFTAQTCQPTGWGRICSHLGVAVLVQLDETGDVHQVAVPRRSGYVTGDVLRLDEGRIVERAERRSLLQRRTGRRFQEIAANVDRLLLVLAPQPCTAPEFIESAIVYARSCGLEPVLLCNKIDMPGGEQYWRAMQDAYGASVQVLGLSALTGAGLQDVQKVLPARTCSVLAGNSGVGKSSILNWLLPDVERETAPVGMRGKRGRHTTTAASLHPVDGAGDIIDTPGFGSFGLGDVAPRDLARWYPGFESALGEPCRFDDCRHDREPDCRVREALERGEVAPERHERYLRLMRELESRTSW